MALRVGSAMTGLPASRSRSRTATSVVVVEVGGLRTYSVAGREVLDGYGADELCRSGRGQVLIPWPNRLEDGSYEFDGGRHQVPIDDPAENDAIHGLVRWAAWTLGRRRRLRRMEHLLHPRPGYPFSLALEHRVRALGQRAVGHDHGDERRARSLSLRMRFAPVPHARHGADRLARPARPRRHGPVLRRAGPPDRQVVGRGDGVRLPAAAADRLDAARQLLHGPRARRRRPRARRAR